MSTETTYRTWLETLGPLTTAYQEAKRADVLHYARELDDLPLVGSHVVDRRARLLDRLRWASRDLKNAIADTRVLEGQA